MVPEFGIKLDGIVYIDRPGTYVVIENNHNRIVVIRTGIGYFLPGGGIDPGETDVDALKREVIEEIGHQISAITWVGEAVEYIQANSDDRYYKIQSKFYKAQIGLRVGEGVEKDHRLVWLWQRNAIKLLVRQSQVWAVQQMAKSKHNG